MKIKNSLSTLEANRLIPRLGFFFNFCENDCHLVEGLVRAIKKHHPDSSILGIADGPVPSLNDCPATILYEDHLKCQGSIGLFTLRNFKAILQHIETEWIVKLDPDSKILRPIHTLPDGDWGGVVRRDSRMPGSTWVKGGGYAIRRKIIQAIIESNLLLHPSYFSLSEPEEEGRVFEDYRLGQLIVSLGFTPVHWSEVGDSKVCSHSPKCRRAIDRRQSNRIRTTSRQDVAIWH